MEFHDARPTADHSAASPGSAAAAYGREVARRRRVSLAVLACVAVLVCVAGWFGEVEPATLANHLSALTSYFSRIMPPLSIANFAGDVAEWYWIFSGG